MRSVSINPILLLILVHTWARIKKMPAGGSSEAGLDTSLPGWPESVMVSRNFRRWLGPQLRIEGIRIDPQSWELALSSPLFQRNYNQGRSSPSELATSWGSPQAPVLVTDDEIQALAQDVDSQGDLPLLAVGIQWRREWEDALPGNVLGLISHAQKRKTQVWMHIPADFDQLPISEDTLRRSTQVGWSWWFVPPSKSEDFPQWFEKYRPAWGFWLCSPSSDQWAWPWMDIFARCLVSKMGARAFDRSWQGDARQRSSWNKLEIQAWRRGCEVLGGEDEVQEMIAQALLCLVRGHQVFR